MRKTWAICRKELQSFFYSPVAYVAFAFYALLSSVMFYMNFVGMQPSIIDVRYIVSNTAFIYLFIIPLLTMRLMADEFRQGTDELLLTSPTSLTEIVLGKYAAALVVNTALMAFSFIYALIMAAYGPLDQPVLWLSYLSIFLVGAAMMAVGLFASCLSSNQMVGGIIGLVILLLFWVMDAIGNSFTGKLKDIITQFSLSNRSINLQKGILSGVDIFFYIGLVIVFLVLSIQVVQRKRWR
ncbi:ABC transporter permease [Paenibacillus sp. N1-5-1-14]|uniref:ABC transporter permease n=1 Tax=Paenibacillus radicibacter TaxID=2972488 RepID=UPI0021592F88|nr:ABC transporter permease [Paenibacillus radicibacter]MCR8644968.1 ABC transporter permease [Paenibacillus radicibacter]